MHISLASEKIASIGSFPITNSMILSWTASIILIFFALSATKKMQLVPKGAQNVFETIVEFLFNMADGVIGNREITKKYFPLLATLFLFVLTNNWLGALPGVGTIGFNELNAEGEHVLVPLLRPGNADLNNTLALAVISVLSIQFFGIITIGFFKYFSKFINFKGPIEFFIGLLELVSEIAKILSFSLRLFGNIFAGEVLLTVIMVILPYLGPIPFSMLELFVGVIQALVFMMLTLVFIKIATSSHDEH